MSEFVCRNGHLMSSKDRRCRECGSSLYMMDGMTSNEWKRFEKWENEQPDEWDEINQAMRGDYELEEI